MAVSSEAVPQLTESLAAENDQGLYWVDSMVVFSIHKEQIAEHGGSAGIRDMRALERALLQPRQLASRLSEGPDAGDLATLAGAYAAGFVTGRPFFDGNKRTGLVVTELFLELNCYKLPVDDTDWVLTLLQFSAGHLSEAGFCGWIRRNIAPSERPPTGLRYRAVGQVQSKSPAPATRRR